MTREADVVRSLVEMADTLVEDYDVVWSPGNFVDISIMLLLVPNCQLALVIRWAYLAEPTLFPDVIVISLDVVEHGGPDLARVAPHVLINQLFLDRRIKRFRRRVAIAYAGVPDRRDNTLGEKAVAVPSRGILGTAVMVRHKLAYAYYRPAGSQRIIQGLEHQARAYWSSTAQPTTLFEHMSISVARYGKPEYVQI